MNSEVVARAAAGLAEYLKRHGGTAVVIGYDARHESSTFARVTAEVMAGAGITAMVLPRALPTPVLAFAIRYLGCDAGVMVTASHNPATDNGYKVYLDGIQIVPPADAQIAALMRDADEIARSDQYQTLDDSVLAAYEQRVVSLLTPGPRDLDIVYTPMHGVGGEVFMQVATACGFPRPREVHEQFDPDPDFPTLPFPNPEEPGAMDLAIAAGRDADIIVANDPDADRLAVAVSGRVLTGDEVGALLGWWVLQRGAQGVFASSIVSGTLLRDVVEAAGQQHVTTLTGFKWIARVPGLVFGYEEALGYCVDPEAVADKDGIAAAMLVLEMAAALKSQGRNMTDVLDDLERVHGVHLTSHIWVPAGDELARLRAQPPSEIGGLPVVSVEDLGQGVDGLPPTEGLRFTMPGASLIVRPSGTEPKLKCYLEVVERIGGQARMAALREGVLELLAGQ